MGDKFLCVLCEVASGCWCETECARLVWSGTAACLWPCGHSIGPHRLLSDTCDDSWRRPHTDACRCPCGTGLRDVGITTTAAFPAQCCDASRKHAPASRCHVW